MANTATTKFRASWKKSVYREFEIRDSANLYKLAETVIGTFGFDFDHAFGFYSGVKGNIYESETCYELFADMGEKDADDARPGQIRLGVKKTLVGKVFPAKGTKLKMLFDYGDDWEFLVEAIGKGEADPGGRYPVLLASKGEAPEQYPEEEE